MRSRIDKTKTIHRAGRPSLKADTNTYRFLVFGDRVRSTPRPHVSRIQPNSTRRRMLSQAGRRGQRSTVTSHFFISTECGYLPQAHANERMKIYIDCVVLAIGTGRTTQATHLSNPREYAVQSVQKIDHFARTSYAARTPRSSYGQPAFVY